MRKTRDRSARIAGDLMRQITEQGAHVRRLGSVCVIRGVKRNIILKTEYKGVWIPSLFPTLS